MSETRLSHDAYLGHLAAESTRFRQAMADVAPEARVPACPAWSAADLLWHLGGEVQAFWAYVVRTRPAPPTLWDEPERPLSMAGLLALFDRVSADLQEALAAADAADPAWSWAPDQTVGFTIRRQTLEAQIHRLDAEQTIGAVTPLDPLLSADGVAETLGVMYGGAPEWGTFEPGPDPATVRWDLIDTDQAVWTQLGTFSGTDPESGRSYVAEEDLDVCDDPGPSTEAETPGTAPRHARHCPPRCQALSPEMPGDGCPGDGSHP